MTPAEQARAILAAYLRGERSDRAQLEAAAQAADAVPLMRQLFGATRPLDSEESGPCRVFAARLEVFADLSAGDRQRRMPELAEHLATCEPCQDLFAALEPPWVYTAGAVVAGVKQGARLRLARALRFVTDTAGRFGCLVSDLRSGLVALAGGGTLTPSTLLGDDASSNRPRERAARDRGTPAPHPGWELPLSDGPCTIRLVPAEASHPLEVRIQLLAGHQGIPVAIEVSDPAGTPFFMGSVSGDGECRIPLALGVWRFHLRAVEPRDAPTWEFEVDLGPEGPADPLAERGESTGS